jgi:hypothetical protein
VGTVKQNDNLKKPPKQKIRKIAKPQRSPKFDKEDWYQRAVSAVGIARRSVASPSIVPE